MPVAITTLRSTLATALTDDTRWQTFAYPPTTILVNSLIISPNDPYLVPNNNQWNISPTARFRLTLTVPLYDNQGNLNGIEDSLVALFNKISASTLSITVGGVSAPSVMTVPSGELLSVEIDIETLTTWS
jgi:hypothetical protein